MTERRKFVCGYRNMQPLLLNLVFFHIFREGVESGAIQVI